MRTGQRTGGTRPLYRNQKPKLNTHAMVRIRFSYWPILLLLLWGCRKDVEKFDPYEPSADELTAFLAEQVPNAAATTVFTFNYLSADKILETPNGTRVYLVDPDHLFADPSGSSVTLSACQDLKIEITEALDKSDIIARELYTVDADGKLFESGGMVNVNVTCGGILLSLLPDRTLKVQVPNSQPQTGFMVFSKDGDHWLNKNQEVFEAQWPAPGGGTYSGYELLLKQLGWAGAGKSYTDTTSNFCVELPQGFGGANTLAFMVFKNQQTVAPLSFDLGKNKFCFPEAPVGFQVQLAAVSKLGAQYWLGKSQTEIGTNATVPVNNQQMTQQAVVNYFKGL